MSLQELAILRLPQSTLQDVEIGAAAFVGKTTQELDSFKRLITVKSLGSDRYSVKWDQGAVDFQSNIRGLQRLVQSTTMLRMVFETAFSGNS